MLDQKEKMTPLETPSTSPQVPAPVISSTPLNDIQAPAADHIESIEKVAYDLKRLLGNSEMSASRARSRHRSKSSTRGP